jgi:hypothetical protein
MEEGMPRDEAERTARREFGNVGLIRSGAARCGSGRDRIAAGGSEACFRRLRKVAGIRDHRAADAGHWHWREYGGLQRAQQRAAAAAALSGAATAGFAPPQRAGRAGAAEFRNELRLSASMYSPLPHNRTFQSVGVWGPGTASITGLAQPEQVNTAQISGGVLETLNVPALDRPMAYGGRSGLPWAGAGDVELWLLAAPLRRRSERCGAHHQRQFAAARDRRSDAARIQGRQLRLRSAGADGLDPVKEQLAGFAYRGIARLRPGVDIPQANADVARLLNVWMDSWTNGPGSDPHWYLRWKIAPAIEPLKETVVGSIQAVLWVVMGTIGVVMLIACTNVANLLLVRADARQQELAVRSALGAGRWRIARELLLESVTLGLLGGAAGVAVAYAGLRLLTAIGPAELPRLSEISLDGRSIAFTLILSVLSGLFFGAIPVLRYAPSRQRTDLARSDADGERKPRTAARPQPAGDGAGGHGAGAAHRAVLMIRTFWRCAMSIPASPIRHLSRSCVSPFRRRWCAIPRQLCACRTASRQAGCDSRRLFRRLRRFRSHERSRTELG